MRRRIGGGRILAIPLGEMGGQGTSNCRWCGVQLARRQSIRTGIRQILGKGSFIIPLAPPFPRNRSTNLNFFQRARAYLLSPEPVDTPLEGRKEFGCNCYSAGEETYTECIMPQAHKAMLSFLKLVADVPGYEEVAAFQPPEGMDGEVILDER